MKGRSVNIPVQVIQWAFKSNRLDDLRLFMQIKAREGRFIKNPSRYPLYGLNRLMRLGMLKEHLGYYYQVAWENVFPTEGQYTHAKLKVEVLDDPKLFKAMLFVIGCSYLMSPQAQRKSKTRRGKPERIHVNESAHMGGISHTICMSFFGFKKSWCSKMRALCEKLCLARWERRWVEAKQQTKFGLNGVYIDSVVDRFMDGDGRFSIEDDHIFEEITSKFVKHIDVMLHIPFEYRKLSNQAYS